MRLGLLARRPATVPGLPRKLPIQAEPKPILNAHRTHTMRVSANALNTIIIVLIAHLRCTIAAVQDRERGDAHQADERRRRHLPGVVA